jgi:hypothetical protein
MQLYAAVAAHCTITEGGSSSSSDERSPDVEYVAHAPQKILEVHVSLFFTQTHKRSLRYFIWM